MFTEGMKVQFAARAVAQESWRVRAPHYALAFDGVDVASQPGFARDIVALDDGLAQKAAPLVLRPLHDRYHGQAVFR